MSEPGWADGWRNAADRAWSAADQGRYGEAAIEVGRALALARDNRGLTEWDEAGALAVEIYRQAGLPWLAADVITELCDRDPGSTPGPWMARALACMAGWLSRPEESIAHRLAGLGPQQAGGWRANDHLAHVRCLLETGRVREAEGSVVAAIESGEVGMASAVAVARVEIALAAGDLTAADTWSQAAVAEAEPGTRRANVALLARADVAAAIGRPGEVLDLVAGSVISGRIDDGVLDRSTVRLDGGTALDAPSLVRRHRLVANAYRAQGRWEEAVGALEDLRLDMARDRLDAPTLVEVEQRLALVNPVAADTEARRKTIELSRLVESDERTLSIVSREIAQDLDRLLEVAERAAEPGGLIRDEADRARVLLSSIALSIEDLETIGLSGVGSDNPWRGAAPEPLTDVVETAANSVDHLAAAAGVTMVVDTSGPAASVPVDPETTGYLLGALLRSLLALDALVDDIEISTELVADGQGTHHAAVRLVAIAEPSAGLDSVTLALTTPHLAWTAMPAEINKAMVPACLAVAQRLMSRVGGRIELEDGPVDGYPLRRIALRLVTATGQSGHDA